MQTDALLLPLPFAAVPFESPPLSRPEIAFDCSFSSSTFDSASPPLADASPPCELDSAPSPVASEGPLVPPVAEPPEPPSVVVVWVLVALFSWWHWSELPVLPVACCLQTVLLLPDPLEPGSPALSWPEIAFDCSFPSSAFASASPPLAAASPPSELASAPSPTASAGPLVPPVAEPPDPPSVVVVCVLLALLS